jgi:hypothetical protein
VMTVAEFVSKLKETQSVNLPEGGRLVAAPRFGLLAHVLRRRPQRDFTWRL